jgi:chemotaxis response regulator CheB
MTRSASSLTSSHSGSSVPRGAAVAIVGSAGGIPALFELLSGLPCPFPFPIVVAQHLSTTAASILPAVLALRAPLAAKWAEPGEVPRGGIVYVTPPAQQLAVTPDGFVISALAPAARSWLAYPDTLLESFAACYGTGAVGIVLSGMLPVGTFGLREIQRAGGITMAQSPSSAPHLDMPIGAIDLGKAEIISSPAGLARALAVLAEAWDQAPMRGHAA